MCFKYEHSDAEVSLASHIWHYEVWFDSHLINLVHTHYLLAKDCGAVPTLPWSYVWKSDRTDTKFDNILTYKCISHMVFYGDLTETTKFRCDESAKWVPLSGNNNTILGCFKEGKFEYHLLY